MPNSQTKTVFKALLAVALLGSVSVAVKATLANTPTIGIARLALALILSIVWVSLRKEWRKLSRSELIGLIQIGLLFALHWLTLFAGIKLATASLAMVGVASYGVHLVLLSRILRGDRLYFSDLLGLSLAISGTLLLVPEWSFSNRSTLGLLLCVLSGFFYALLPLMHQKQARISNSLRTFGQFLVALIVFTFLTPYSDWNLHLKDWLLLLYLSVGCTVIAHTLWVQATTELAPAVTSILYYAGVPIALALSYLLLNESLSLELIIGSSMIVAGNVLSLSARFRRGIVLQSK